MSNVVALMNFTPHPVTLFTADEAPVTFPVDGAAPRVAVDRSDAELVETNMGRFSLVETRRENTVTDLPAPRPGVVFIVSRVVAEAVPGRRDLVFPDDAVRDDAGVIIGARALGRLA